MASAKTKLIDPTFWKS